MGRFILEHTYVFVTIDSVPKDGLVLESKCHQRCHRRIHAGSNSPAGFIVHQNVFDNSSVQYVFV